MDLARVTGSETLSGNQVALQFDGPTTFEAWLDAIDGAKKFVYFENYLVRDDEIGRRFRDALVRKAREGVPVYLLRDWFGCWATPRSFWKPLVAAGVHVTAFNPPWRAVRNPFAGFQRDHRKLVVVDGEVAHLGGLCVGQEWAGTPEEAPWRDTGVELRGPVALAAARAFEHFWGRIVGPLAHSHGVDEPLASDGVPVWLIEGEPGRARVYRTLQLGASRARRTIWITDAYFVSPRPLAEGLCAAAQQGVDVRILVPAHNNWPIVGSVSRGGYRALLEAGVRIFEWQGPMIHAKTSVVDGVWCRIGSSNLNFASLMGNWELDVGVLDGELGRQMQGLFLADLASSVEIVLPGGPAIGGRRVSTATGMSTRSLDPDMEFARRLERLRDFRVGPSRLSLASVVRAGESLGDALSGNRTLGREDRTVVGTLSIAVLLIAVFSAIFPAAIGYVVASLAGWFGISTGFRALRDARRARREEEAGRLRKALESDGERVEIGATQEVSRVDGNDRE